MENKIIKKGQDVQQKIIAGVVKTADAVKVTLGPSGKGVAMMNGFGVEISRDGATVAKSIQLSDPEENIGAELVKKAASLTEDLAGDGTSSTSILIKEFCLKGQKAVGAGANVNELKSGMQKAGKWMEKFIKDNAIEVDGDLEKIRKVATISANNDPEVGNLVVKGLTEVGLNGLVTADMASGIDTVIDTTTGMKIDRGWAAPQYASSPEDGTCVMENPYIIIVGEKISTIKQMIPFLSQYDQQGEGRPLLIVCDDIDDSVNTMLILNNFRGSLKTCVVKGIDFGDGRKNIMEDIAVAVGGVHLCTENGMTLNQATLACLGSANRVVVSRDSTVIYEGAGDPQVIQDRANVIKARLSDPTTTDYDKTKFEKRLANLTGGIAIIKAGGASEVEKQNRKATIEDSILAAKSAIEEGCAPGGGYVFFRGSVEAQKDKSFWKNLTEDEKEGARIVFSSLPVVMRTIAENSGKSGEVILEQASRLKEGQGYNAKTKKVGDLVEEGVLDSAKVLRVSLENSISAASMILLIDCTITDEPKKDCCCCAGGQGDPMMM